MQPLRNGVLERFFVVWVIYYWILLTSPGRGNLGPLVANLVFCSKRSLPYQREVWRDYLYGRGLFRETHKKSDNLSIIAVR